MSLYSGPLPFIPPPILAEYEDNFPGLANKLIEWTEAQRGHRQQMEAIKLERLERRFDRGQIMAFVVSLVGLGFASVVGLWGSQVVGSIIAIVSIGGPTAAIFLARNTGTKPPSKPETAKVPRSDPPS